MKMFFTKTKLVMLLFVATAIFTSCSSDDDGGSEADVVNLEGVPTGEIVAIDLRNVTLTGFSSLDRNEGSQKWW